MRPRPPSPQSWEVNPCLPPKVVLSNTEGLGGQGTNTSLEGQTHRFSVHQTPVGHVLRCLKDALGLIQRYPCVCRQIMAGDNDVHDLFRFGIAYDNTNKMPLVITNGQRCEQDSSRFWQSFHCLHLPAIPSTSCTVLSKISSSRNGLLSFAKEFIHPRRVGLVDVTLAHAPWQVCVPGVNMRRGILQPGTLTIARFPLSNCSGVLDTPVRQSSMCSGRLSGSAPERERLYRHPFNAGARP